jgi:hypothetical protein
LAISNTRPVPAFQEQLPLDERGEAALRKIVARSDAEHFGAGHSVKVRIRSSTILTMAIAHSHINHGACLSAEQYRNQIALFGCLMAMSRNMDWVRQHDENGREVWEAIIGWHQCLSAEALGVVLEEDDFDY